MTHITNGYLVQRIQKAKDDPENEDHAHAQGYWTRFRALESYFFEKIHPFVDVGLAIDQTRTAKKGNNPDIMTIHGCRHVSDLVESLDKLGSSIEKKQGTTPLNPLESYILLCAAHVHDVGNIKGRKDHPKNSGELINLKTTGMYRTSTGVALYCLGSYRRKHPLSASNSDATPDLFALQPTLYPSRYATIFPFSPPSGL